MNVTCLLSANWPARPSHCNIVARRGGKLKVKSIRKETKGMDGTRFIVAGSFIDGSGAPVRRNVFLKVTDTIISAIGSATDLSGHDGAAIDDFSHCTILPPLVDCSLSLSRSPSVDSSVRFSSAEGGLAEKAAMVARHIRDCHAHGVLGVADSDGRDLAERSHERMAGGASSRFVPLALSLGAVTTGQPVIF